MTIIEAVPNVSEGRRQDVIDELEGAVRRVPTVALLDLSADPSHNRSVLTIVGDTEPLIRALLSLYEVATRRIDLALHRGAHPRIGAVDVVPFIPIQDASMRDCVNLANRLGRAVADRFAVPVFLYGSAASRPERRPLEAVRRGQFERLAEKMAEEPWQPDFGPATPHPTAGASAIGARELLIAFNINLETDQLDAATRIARAIRERDGGLPCVKAMALRLEGGTVQVSINLTDYRITPLHTVLAAVEREAAAHQVDIANTEIVGLAPLGAMVTAGAQALRLSGFTPTHVLEARLCPRKALPLPPNAEGQ